MTTSHGPRILLVDDAANVRAALRSLLETVGLAVVGEAADGEAGVAATQALRPDIVLMDWRMPRMDGLAATRQITALGLGVQVIIISAFATSGFADKAREAGAVGLIAKGESPAAVLAAIDRAWQGRHAKQPASSVVRAGPCPDSR